MRKYISIFIIPFLIFCTAVQIAAEEIDSLVYAELVNSIAVTEAPRIKDGYIIFTADGKKRHTGIAFEHETYKYTHSFKKISGLEAEVGTAEPVMFFIMKIPESMNKIRYRIVTDGLWTSDPSNPDTEYDYNNGFMVSCLDIPFVKEFKTEPTAAGVNFVYKGEPNQMIGLAGSFNNWDPFMYLMKETSEGVYQLELPLPKGTWIYSYFIGFERKTDNTNPNRVYSTDGKTASLIELN